MSLHVVTSHGHGDAAWEVEGDPSRITLGALAEAVGLPPGSATVLVDGRPVPATATVAEVSVPRGARLATPSGAAAPGPASDGPVAAGAGEAAAWLCHEAGLGAGGTVALPPGRHALGPALAGPSGVHEGLVTSPAATVDTAEDGRWLEVPGGVFRLDARPPTPPRRRPADERGLVVVHRPPRRPAPPPATVPSAPVVPDAPRPPAPLSWITVLGPLPVVAVMALVFSPRFALLGLAGPLLAFGRWGEGRARHRRESRRHAVALTTARSEHAAALRLAAESERARRWAIAPGPGEVAAAAAGATAPTWERRGADDDALVLAVGAWSTPWPADRSAVEGTRLGPVPCLVPLAERHAIGVVGPDDAAHAVARWLVAQAAALHGPADVLLAAALAADAGGPGPEPAGWGWLRWLPHLQDRSGQRRVASSLDDLAVVLAGLAEELQPTTPARPGTPSPARPERFGLLLVTAPELARSRVARDLVVRGHGALRAVVIAPTPDELPAWCDVVVDVTADGSCRVLDAGVPLDGVLATGVDRAWAERVARSLGRLDDPERTSGGTGIPARLGLADLLVTGDALDDVDRLADRLERRWDAGAGLAVPVGADEQGAFVLDLVADGPHALVAGTTGAGKSELLRTWVASLAASASPDDVNLILVDFKGGGAFDACATLPHTVAVVTDLDAHLAARALRCLRAEVRHRETQLRAAGVSDLAQYAAARTGEPLPRLVVVIDEFATLAAELPTFVGSIVDIAQRGRSLGIHLVLATQRPSGVVDGKVRANANLRIALRVQDDADSLDVLGTAEAARLSRRSPGRALVRLGSGDVQPFQTALVSTVTVPAGEGTALSVRPFTLAADATEPGTGHEGGAPTAHAAAGPTDLERFAAAACLAARRRGCRPPRIPWPAPLPASLDATELWAAVEPEPWCVPIGLADEPDHQRQTARSWRATDGSLLVYGANGLDTSRALATVAAGVAARHRADDAHLYVIDGGSAVLAPLGDLPHCGGYASGADTGRVVRLLEVLSDELDRRRALARRDRLAGLGPDAVIDGDRVPLVVVVVENAGAVVDALEADGERDAVAQLAALVRDGAALGVLCVVGVPHERALPSRLAGLVPQRLVLRMADPTSYLALGLVARDLPALRGLRAVSAPDGLEVQLADVGDVAATVARLAARTPAPRTPPAAVRTLGARVPLTDVDPARGSLTDELWSLPVAVGPSLRPVALDLPRGIHALVSGGPGSGRSTTLVTIAQAALAASGGDVRLVAVAPRRSALERLRGGVRHVADAVTLESAVAAAGDDPCLVLVDDAELVPAPLGQALARLVEAGDDRVHVVAAGRADALRSATAWTSALRHGRTGIVLQPATGDGDVLRTALPLRLSLAPAPGRGYVVSLGSPVTAQVAIPVTEPVTA